MSISSANAGVGDYDVRSLRHERRMLEVYRRGAASGDGSQLQPLANACWRAASFEWALYREAETVRRLWGEAARALAQGFARRPSEFDPSPDQLLLALHFAVAAREREAFTALARTAPNLRDGSLREARAFRDSRAHFHLAEGYTLVARALVEEQMRPAQLAAEALEAARHESDAGWWERQFPHPLEAAWRASEHEAICSLLGAVARRLANADSAATIGETNTAQLAADDFARATDDALRRLARFVTGDANHHPKLYVWLPGLALCAFATSAALPMDWLAERRETKATGYERLPLELLRHPLAEA